MASEETVIGLREAVKVSPDNLPLRVLLGDALVALGRFQEAEAEFIRAMAMAPNDNKILFSLANVMFQGGKYNQSLVMIEDLLKKEPKNARAYVLHARLLLNEGNSRQASAQYSTATKLDASVKDDLLAEMLAGAEATGAPDSHLVDGKIRVAQTDDGQDPEDDDSLSDLVETSTIDFSDVGGMEVVKEQIRVKLIYPITHAETYKAYGKKIGGGILLYGPPGCGKTYLARATAGEVKARFIPVGLHQVLDMWIGSSERNLHQVFQIARGNTPCVLFFDEVDALAASRSDMKHAAGRHVINQFLNEMDGVTDNNDGLLILAATNAPWHIDAAFRRPGRFDRIIFVPPPDEKARAEIFRVLLKGKPIESIDFEHLARKTDKFSGADLMAVVNEAVEAKINEAMKSGVPKPMSTKDLERSIKAVKPSTSEWFATARNYAIYSNEGGQYDDILKYLNIK